MSVNDFYYFLQTIVRHFLTIIFSFVYVIFFYNLFIFYMIFSILFLQQKLDEYFYPSSLYLHYFIILLVLLNQSFYYLLICKLHLLFLFLCLQMLRTYFEVGLLIIVLHPLVPLVLYYRI